MGVKETVVTFMLKLIQWRRLNPKKSFFLMIVTLMYLYHRTKKYIRGKRSLANKVVLITGGVSGIGRSTALMLKRMNAIVIVWDINKAGLKEMECLVDMTDFVDITNKSKVNEAAQKVFERYRDGIDILINNAGIVFGKSIMDLSENQIRKCFDVNVIAHFWTIQGFLPKMIEKRSNVNDDNNWCQIVTISSTAGRCGVSMLSDYCASKYACNGLTQSLYAELAENGQDHIGVTIIMPYLVNTGMFEGAAVARKGWTAPLMRLCGCYWMEQDYVASEIINAIQYNTRYQVLPHELDTLLKWEHSLSVEVKDFIVKSGPSMHQLMGRNHKR